MKRLLFGLIGGVAVLFAPAAARADVFTVLVQNGTLSFTPSDITIFVGDGIVWAWVLPNGLAPHSTTSDTALWDSGFHFSPFRFRRIFLTPGDYPYHCSLHGGTGGLGMSGVIHVTLGPSPDDDDDRPPHPASIRR